MALRDIMVVLDGSAQSEIRLTVAGALARKHEASLLGFCALDMLRPVGVGARPGDYPEADTNVAEMAERIEAGFRDRLRFGALQGDWRVASGKGNEALVRQARRADLIILGQVDPDHPPPTGRHLVEDVLLTVGRPILVIPYAGSFETLGTNVLIGWNDSREAARALNDSIPLLVKAASVIVLEARRAGARPDYDDAAAAGVAHHLARHGIKARTAHTAMIGISAPDALLAYAADMGADLLVVGGYGHSRLRELILGGVTRGLLQHMTLPVLMSH
jgi:nucleotide-binding universal stress UspA family protein